ncbi:phospholysine phosphohistidine inorganic pyrophosphate phosphatase [Nematostella vectensis]|uniref:phospholysine phosphohistidine inorganic pyrophosphate phosphatase n=1 Tax=Nematostella vectensis TaxID=45351 RepID=UPI0020774BBD|nr:phospholysine phosphohistidine inorganic pyrophosphate phosphatase [Nematostella vectensis]
MADTKPKWLERNVSGVLLDISGVLYNSGKEGGEVIPGSVEALERLKAAGFKVRLCTNETQCTREDLVKKLGRFGYKLSVSEMFAPAPAMRAVLQKRDLRPHFLIHAGGRPDFEGLNCDNPNCVVIGDAAESFTYESMNTAFRVLLENHTLFSMGYGKYYRTDGQLVLDVGPFAKALEYACDTKAEIVGKPSALFFTTALEDMGVAVQDAIMIGDDIQNDVGGAQAAGIRGVQVRTGKFRPEDEKHPTVKPDGFVDNLAHAVGHIVKYGK